MLIKLPKNQFNIKAINRGRHLLFSKVGDLHGILIAVKNKAAKVLDIIAHPDSVGSGLLGLTASVPTFNGYSNYVRKLVLTGEKVGIVAQTESSAEKKVSQTSSTGPFSR